MSDTNYHIKLNFCQLTLDQLRNPFIHKSNGCQFNHIDDQQNLSICPVCQIDINKKNNSKQGNDKIMPDEQLFVQLEQKNENQIFYDKIKDSLFSTKRRNYTQDSISQIKEVKELQKSFYQYIRSKKMTIEIIQEISQQRNQQYFSCLKNLSDTQKIPILMAVINNRLVLFYHLYKLKIELTLLDVTNPKIRQKLGFNTHGALQQIMFFENNIYFLYLKQNQSILFVGDFQQIFKIQNTQEAQFQIISIPFCKLDGPSRLLQTGDKELIMFGNRQFYQIKQQTYQSVVHPLDQLISNTQCHYFNNKQILIVNQEEEDIMSKKYNLNYFCYDISKSNFVRDTKNSQDKLSMFKNFDNYVIFVDQMVLFQTEELRNDNCQTMSISSWLPNTQKATPNYMKTNVINHQSYMQPVKVISTQKCMNNITCLLIGMRLSKKEFSQQDDKQDIFPALLVYNGQTKQFEVELI